ncbi:hypothetical protein CCMA1212_000472 [Trichoderma ghanense]|uniref:Uncharacterized protein n=1 Tax=Trichoderma ghanense TaxID=65468 RepID=A0ABY2HE80_9HYPO
MLKSLRNDGIGWYKAPPDAEPAVIREAGHLCMYHDAGHVSLLLLRHVNLVELEIRLSLFAASYEVPKPCKEDLDSPRCRPPTVLMPASIQPEQHSTTTHRRSATQGTVRTNRRLGWNGLAVGVLHLLYYAVHPFSRRCLAAL